MVAFSVSSRRLVRSSGIILTLLAVALVLAAPNAFAVKRILLVGDSWTQWPLQMGAYQSVLDGNFGAGTYEVEGTYTALGGTTADEWAHNFVPPEGTFPSPPGHTNMPVLDRITWSLNQYPTIDIVHLSISGNDMWSWRVGWTTAQENALFDTIQQNVQTVFDWIHANHPRVKVLLVDYDFLNITENCTYGMAEYNDTAALFSAALGFTVGDFNQNRANTQVLNGFFTRFSPRKITVANSAPRGAYIQNWGNVQWRVGYVNSLARLFDPQTVPYPGIAPDYIPMPGGDITYGTPSLYMNTISTSHPKQRDAIHLSSDGYKLLMDSCVMQYYAGWLTDTTPPAVQSITRVQPSPTTAPQVQFLVTFSEAVRGVDATDFALTGLSASGSSILSVTGADNTATRTVTVDTSGAPDGVLGLNFVDDGTVYDMNWNAIGGEGPGNGDYSAGQTYLIDRYPPTATITPGVPEPTELSAVPVTVTFSEDVTGFTSSDVAAAVMSGSGTVEVTAFSGSGKVYTFTLLANRTETITVALSIPAGAAQDPAGRGNLAAAYADGADNAYQFDFPTGPADPGSLYASSGQLGALSLPTAVAVSINTGTTPPTFQVGGNAPLFGKVYAVTGGNVAKFEFSEVGVSAAATVSVTGNRPLVIAASGNMQLDAALDLSGSGPGRAGGGVGGAGGPGGTGVAGGVGGSGVTGGARSAGGLGSPNATTNYGLGLGYGQNGTGRNGGSGGSSGSVGTAGSKGTDGTGGSQGFGAQGTAGTGSAGGSRGAAATATNGGTAGGGGGSGGGGGAPVIVPPNGNAGGAGSAASVAGTGAGTGSVGTQGGSGQTGTAGVDAQFTADASSLLLSAGHGGGGGGGGGSGAGGQGGGQGGGGSGGSSGGGGGLGWVTWVGQCNTAIDGAGGQGGYGGKGGDGGSGGSGGDSAKGGDGGSGGNGGGAVVLAARGLLTFDGAVDISGTTPVSAGTASGAMAGVAGTDPGSNGEAGGAGVGGAAGVYYVNAGGCWPFFISGGAGGAGTSGGGGGVGGGGGSSGASGAGGNGGLGTPGMVKLHSSVIQAASGHVNCNNFTASTGNALRGRATLISNMQNAPQPLFSDDILSGATANDLLLKAPAPYAAALQTPLIPQLADGIATGGFTAATFWNQDSVIPVGTDLLELVRLAGASSPFAGFDQIFLVNNGGADAENVVLQVAGYAPLAIGTIPDGKIWTTTVPTGVAASFSATMEAAILEPSATLYTGDTLTLHAQATGGAGTKTYRWLRDGVQVQQGPSAVFTVASAAPADSGAYTVEVTDQASQTVTSAGVPVSVADVISVTTPPASAAARVGENQVFTVAASGGHGTLHYDWRRNTASLGAPDYPYLAVNPVSLADAGTYDVVITDSLGVAPKGRVTTPVPGAVLTVTDPLTVSGPDGLRLYSDAAQAAFTVGASGGVPGYSYSWRRNGQPLGAPQQPNGPVLTLSAPLSGQTGNYDCVVTDSNVPADTENSAAAALAVYAHLGIQLQPQGGPQLLGGSVTFVVVASGGMPDLQYVWRKNGTPLPLGSQPNGSILGLSNLALTDAGGYDVVVYDEGGESITTNTATITVAPPVPLQITGQPAGGTIAAGESFVFTVTATGGTGTVHYQWRFQPEGSGTSQPLDGDAPSLTVSNATAGDSGFYWVEVSDTTQTLTSGHAELTVTEVGLPVGVPWLLAIIVMALAVAGIGRRRAAAGR